MRTTDFEGGGDEKCFIADFSEDNVNKRMSPSAEASEEVVEGVDSSVIRLLE